MLRPNLRDYADAYIPVNGTITIFQGVNGLFVLSFENENRASHSAYYLPRVKEIKSYML